MKSKWKQQSVLESSKATRGARTAVEDSSTPSPAETICSSLMDRVRSFGLSLVPVVWVLSLLALGASLFHRKNAILQRINKREEVVIGLDEIIKATRIAALRGCVRTSEYQTILSQHAIKSWRIPNPAPGTEAARHQEHRLQVQIGAGPRSSLKIFLSDDGQWITEVEAPHAGKKIALKAMLFPWGGK